MKFQNDDERRKYFQELGRRGGQANVRNNGREHMSKIGRKGFESTARHFHSEKDYKLWLASLGAYVYWQGTGLPPKYDANGHSVFPQEKPSAPWDKDYTEF